MFPYGAPKKWSYCTCKRCNCPADPPKTAYRREVARQALAEVPFHKPSKWEDCHDPFCNCDKFCDCCLQTNWDWTDEEDMQAANDVLMSEPLTQSLGEAVARAAA